MNSTLGEDPGPPEPAPTLEDRFANLEQAVATAGKRAAALRTAVTALGKAAAAGDLRAIRGRIARVNDALEAALGAIQELEPSLGFTESAEPDLLRTALVDELIETARARGIVITQRDRDLLAFPLVIRIDAEQRRLNIGSRKVSTLRPSVVVSEIDASRSRDRDFDPERFATLLYSAHTHRMSDESSARLDDLWELLTLMPTSRAEYPKDAFYADVHRLDRSSLRATKSGVTFSLPRGSTGMRDGGAVVFAEDGEACEYYRIVFEALEKT